MHPQRSSASTTLPKSKLEVSTQISEELAPTALQPSQWLETLNSESSIKENHAHYWGNDPSCLITKSSALPLIVSNGQEVFETTLLPALEAAEHEVILVTCFWAQSPTLTLLSASLTQLSQKALSRDDGTKLRVRLCFSSRSLFQKLFHPSSRDGYLYPASTWTRKLGLPPPEQLRGLDLQVRSKFYRPFSVMHPKFMIVDRRKAFMPSCNASWENWLECCLPFEGPVVTNLLQFYQHFWERGDLPATSTVENPPPALDTTSLSSLPTILLPSPHHAALFLSIPFLSSPPPPPTPLNTLLLQLFANAQQSITLLTPNLTSPPVITALLDALRRGINVSITTNRRMMVLEQLVTAGTITEFCVWRMAYAHRQLLARARRKRQYGDSYVRVEEGRAHERVGRLRIGYFKPSRRLGGGEVKCHVKCTVVDGEVVVLGSGNMDRASWYTSQELGIALFGREIVEGVWERLEESLEGRVERYYDRGYADVN